MSSTYSLCKQWTVGLGALSTAVLLFVQWPVLFATASVTPAVLQPRGCSYLVVVVLVLQPASCRLQLLCFTLFTCAPRSASHAVRSSPCYHQSASLSCAIWPCSAFCTDTASAPRSAHHYHPLCPLPRRPGTFSDQHTDATDCSPRRNLLKAIRLHLFSTALWQAIARRKLSS